MNRRILGIAIIVVASVIVVLGGAGVAYAYWSAGGSGAGAGTAGTTVPLVLSSATPSAGLLPGGSASVTVVATNSNLAQIHVTSFSLDTTQGTGGFSVDAAHSGCVVSALSFTTQTNSGTGWTIPAKIGGINGTLSVTLPSSVTMSTSAANACQGATFTVYLVAT